jgi:hypothetical protein
MINSSAILAGAMRVLISLPTLAAFIAGLVLALVRMKKHPKASIAAAIGFGGLLFFHIVSQIISGFLLTFAMQREMYEFYQIVQTLYSLASAVLGAACYGILIYGYFFAEGRGDKASPNAAP